VRRAACDANALSLVGAITEAGFVPSVVNLGTTCWWRVDEVNGAETPSLRTGDIRGFSTRE
jgi:hypothetical protein